MHHAAATTNSNQLISWNEIPVEKKIETQLVKKIPKTVQETPSYYCVHNNLLADSELLQFL